MRPDPTWTIVVPIKDTTRAKSRLAVHADQRQALAVAMAMDTAAVATGAARVVAVVESAADAAELRSIEAVTVLVTAVRGLNAAIRDGLRDPAIGDPVGVLPADLPGLRLDDLVDALDLALDVPAGVVADVPGTGTTLLTALRRPDLHPHYGPDSFARHLRAGAQPLHLPMTSSLRRDVDVLADLPSVTGGRTLAVLTDLGLAPPAMCRPAP